MYAVIKTGGKQYKVENEQKILVDRINADEGSIVTLSDLLMVVDSGKSHKVKIYKIWQFQLQLLSKPVVQKLLP